MGKILALIAAVMLSFEAPAAGAAPAGTKAPDPPVGSPGSASGRSAAGTPAATPWDALSARCEKCHNSVDWAGGIAFDTLSATDVASDAETWEKAVRKLRGRLMPPPGQPQPDAHTIDTFVQWMEGELDAVAAKNPSPGNVGLHRLNRTEYARSIPDD